MGGPVGSNYAAMLPVYLGSIYGDKNVTAVYGGFIIRFSVSFLGPCGNDALPGCLTRLTYNLFQFFDPAEIKSFSFDTSFENTVAANNGSADPTLDARANALAQAINKTGVQSVQNPCFIAGFYAASATAATGTALYQVGSANAAFPAFSQGLASLGPTVATATGWLSRTRQLGQKAVTFVVSTVTSGLSSLCQSF